MLSGLNGSGYLGQSFPDFIPEVPKNEFREFLDCIVGMGDQATTLVCTGVRRNSLALSVAFGHGDSDRDKSDRSGF